MEDNTREMELRIIDTFETKSKQARQEARRWKEYARKLEDTLIDHGLLSIDECKTTDTLVLFTQDF